MIASTTLTVGDGGLGTSRRLARPPAVIGCSSGGTAATPALIASLEDAISTFGYGKLTDLLALYLALAGGPVVAVKAASSTAGSCSAVTAGASNTGAAVLSVTTGTARDDFRVVVKVTRAGANPAAMTAAVRISLDNGETYGEEIGVPSTGTFTIGNTGITVDFDAASLVVNDTYSFTATAPIWDATALGLCTTALASTTYDHEFVHIAEQVTGANVGAPDTSISGLETSNVYRWLLTNARDQDVAGSESVSTWQGILVGSSPGFSAITSRHTVVCAGAAETPSPLWDCFMRRGVAWRIGPRLALIREVSGGAGLAEHPGRVRSGALAGIAEGDLYHDLRSLTGLDTNNFMGCQSLPGRPGYYATDRTRATSGSDFTKVMHVRLVKEAARLAVAIMQEYIGENVRTITGGLIDPRDADAIDGYVTAALKRDLVDSGLASFVSCQVDRTNNVVSTSTLNFKVRVRPLGYATTLDIDLSLSTAE